MGKCTRSQGGGKEKCHYVMILWLAREPRHPAVSHPPRVPAGHESDSSTIILAIAFRLQQVRVLPGLSHSVRHSTIIHCRSGKYTRTYTVHSDSMLAVSGCHYFRHINDGTIGHYIKNTRLLLQRLIAHLDQAIQPPSPQGKRNKPSPKKKPPWEQHLNIGIQPTASLVGERVYHDTSTRAAANSSPLCWDRAFVRRPARARTRHSSVHIVSAHHQTHKTLSHTN